MHGTDKTPANRTGDLNAYVPRAVSRSVVVSDTRPILIRNEGGRGSSRASVSPGFPRQAGDSHITPLRPPRPRAVAAPTRFAARANRALGAQLSRSHGGEAGQLATVHRRGTTLTLTARSG
jgi:hypothetical protein